MKKRVESPPLSTDGKEKPSSGHVQYRRPVMKKTAQSATSTATA